jgi:alkylhydroperoxidase family enzyme
MRIEPIKPGTRPSLSDIENMVIADRGRVTLIYQLLLNSPNIARGWAGLMTAVRSNSSLTPCVHELVVVRVMALTGATFALAPHTRSALDAGVPAATVRIAATAGPLTSHAELREADLALLSLVDAMTQTIEVPDAIHASMLEHYGQVQTLDAILAIAAYNMVARVLVALEAGH